MALSEVTYSLSAYYPATGGTNAGWLSGNTVVFHAVSSEVGVYSDAQFQVKIYINGVLINTLRLIATDGQALNIDISNFIKDIPYFDLVANFGVGKWNLPYNTIEVKVQEFYNGALQGTEVSAGTFVVMRGVLNSYLFRTHFEFEKYFGYNQGVGVKKWLTLFNGKRYYYDGKACVIGMRIDVHTNINIKLYNSNAALLDTVTVTFDDYIADAGGIRAFNIIPYLSNSLQYGNEAYVVINSDLFDFEDLQIWRGAFDCDTNVTNFVFLNTLGTYESFPFKHNNRFTVKPKKQTYQKRDWDFIYPTELRLNGGEMVATSDAYIKHIVSSGKLTPDEYNYFIEQLIRSTQVFVENNGELTPVIVTDIVINEKSARFDNFVEVDITYKESVQQNLIM